jgi:hypothetical protein
VEPHPPSTLWTARNSGRQIDCIVRLLESGIDIEILIDNTLHIGRTFASSEEALAFSAEQQRKWSEGA